MTNNFHSHRSQHKKLFLQTKGVLIVTTFFFEKKQFPWLSQECFFGAFVPKVFSEFAKPALSRTACWGQALLLSENLLCRVQGCSNSPNNITNCHRKDTDLENKVSWEITCSLCFGHFYNFWPQLTFQFFWRIKAAASSVLQLHQARLTWKAFTHFRGQNVKFHNAELEEQYHLLPTPRFYKNVMTKTISREICKNPCPGASLSRTEQT